jgi:hypothetical protein
MLSTYTSYNLITRDLLTSLARTASDTVNAREAAYYKENIGRVSSVDEFLDDYRLFSYAMKANGLEEMTYAKAFMRKVLDSDLTDPNSFVNLLTDDRYREFATAFSFEAATSVAQTDAQLDAVIGLYTSTAANAGNAIKEETRYYNIVIDTVTSVDQLLNNDRMRNYVFTAFGVNESTYSRENIKKVLSSDVNDPASYVNTTYIPYVQDLAAKVSAANTQISSGGLSDAQKASLRSQITVWQGQIQNASSYISMASAFNFDANGKATAGTVQDATQKKSSNDLYTLSNPRVTTAAAVMNKEYFESKIGSITTVDELAADSRLVSYIKVAFNMDEATVVNATIKNILTSDLSDPNNYINTFGKGDERYLALRNAFNFQADGTLAAGTAPQTSAQTKTTTNGYMTHYNDKDDAADEKAISRFKSQVNQVTNVKEFVGEATVFDFALKAFGLDPTKVSALTIKNVLTSDLNDPNSYVYKLKDERFVDLAKAFNFGSDGNIEPPTLAQSQSEILVMSKSYVLEKSRFGTADDKKLAEEEAKYYSAQMQKIGSLQDFLSDARLIAFALESHGIDPTSVDADFMVQIFASDLDDPNSFVNQQPDRSFRSIVAAYNFNAEGQVIAADDAKIQSQRGIYETLDNYTRQKMEEDAGNDNAGVRLALYFERKASSISSPYDILADDALFEVVRVIFGLPEELGSADIDAQAETIKRYLNLEDLQDPEKVSKMIVKFAVLYDGENMANTDPALAILGGSGSAGVSADMLMSLAQLRLGGI